jgi:hypothetical protein
MKVLAGIIEMFRTLFINGYDDAYSEYLSEQQGIYIDIKEVYDNTY